MRLLNFLLALVLAGTMVLAEQTGTGQTQQGQTQTPPGQTAPPPPPVPTGTIPDVDPAVEKQKLNDPKRPEDPLSEREKAIRQFDPLAKPAKDADAKDLDGTGKRRDDRQIPDIGDDVKIVDRGAKDQDPDLRKEYSGPAVLTRSYAVERPSLPENMKFRPFVGIREVADTGLNSIQAASQGKQSTQFAYGQSINFGIDGRHLWRHDIVQVGFAGEWSHYGANSSFNGTGATLSVNWTHVISKRLRLSVLDNSNRIVRSNGLTNQTLSPDITVANVNLATTTSTQIFDNSSNQSSNTVTLTWQKSARLAFTTSGTMFFVKRDGVGLVNSQGIQTLGDVTYRLSRKTTIGGFYAHSYYRFSRGLGNTTSDTFGLIYSHAFTTRMEFNARAGISLLQNLGITSVSVDPTIAALLGQTAGVVQAYVHPVNTDVSVSFRRNLGRGRTTSAAYARGTTPGNGVFNTSTQEAYDFSVLTPVKRKNHITTAIGQTKLVSTTQNIGAYGNKYIRFEFSRDLKKNIGMSLSFDYRKFDITDTPVLRNQYRITCGISWSNPEFPRRLF